MEKKKEYTAPRLTVVSFRTERGYAASGLIDALIFWDNDESQNVEQYEEQDDWNSGGSFW